MLKHFETCMVLYFLASNCKGNLYNPKNMLLPAQQTSTQNGSKYCKKTELMKYHYVNTKVDKLIVLLIIFPIGTEST